MVDCWKVIVAAALLVLCGCSSESIPQPYQESGCFEYSVVSGASLTKTSLSDKGSTTSFDFIEGDRIGLFIGDLHANRAFTCTDGTSGTFTGKLKALRTEKTQVAYCAYYPYNKTAGSTASELNGILPGVQKAPFDPSADYLVATPINAPYKEDEMPSLSFSFSNHLFGIVKLSVKDGGSAYSAEKILSVALRSVSAPLAGGFTFDITDPAEPATISPASGGKKVSVEYSEQSAPALGENVTHSVYAVVNPGSFAAGELSLELSTTNYVFSIPIKTTLTISRNQVSVLPVVDISSSSVTRRSRIQTIVLWGDSICGDSFLQAVREELGSNWNVVRSGVAGDSVPQIAGRQGGLPVVTGATGFTIPGNSSESVVFGGIFTQEGEPGSYEYTATTHSWTFKSGYTPLVNPMLINGVECKMSYADAVGETVKISRCQDGDDVVVEPRTSVYTFGAREYAGAEVIVVYMGTNGRPGDSYLISVHNAMKAHLTNPDAKMIVMGFHQSPTDMPQYWSSAYISAFTAEYGDWFIDQRTLGGGENAKALMKEIGQITDESQISADDWTYINRGDWPISWFRGPMDVHPNDQYGAKVRAILLRRRMDELGLL